MKIEPQFDFFAYVVIRPHFDKVLQKRITAPTIAKVLDIQRMDESTFGYQIEFIYAGYKRQSFVLEPFLAKAEIYPDAVVDCAADSIIMASDLIARLQVFVDTYGDHAVEMCLVSDVIEVVDDIEFMQVGQGKSEGEAPAFRINTKAVRDF